MYFDTRYLYILLAIVAVISILSGGFSILGLLLTIPGVLIAITFHEFAHAFVAYKLGDDTPKFQGRLSLNPFSHLDPFGVIMLIFAHIGWGKPVEINPNNFTRKISARTAEALVALAGPLMNFILAIVFAIIFYALQTFATSFVFGSEIGSIIYSMVQYAVIVNIGLGVFNLIPLPPLDGSKIIMPFLPYKAKQWFINNTQIFYLVFIVLWISGLAGRIISPAIIWLANSITNICGLII